MIGIGCDHGGFELKNIIIEYLKKNNIEYKDYGTYSADSVDYPVYAKKVANAVASGECEKGILICGTGIGISITANKVKGIRAALCHDVASARLTRLHNDSNILCMGGRIIGPEHALAVAEAWLGTEFSGDERHKRRINMIEE
ncbi:MAG: ribose 5-phosphate isomerase B [Firmicutes bacterium]|nr:ribose 5-phosphate isomerase B [Bacillota bacterium]